MPSKTQSDGLYSWTWLDSGHNPWPYEEKNRWPYEKFETYGVVDESGKVICVTGRLTESYMLAIGIAEALNEMENNDR
jgi:hypothetical protein